MEKSVSDSYTEQVQILTPSNMNGFGRLFGGQLMEWIDIVAAVTAKRHSQHNVTTVLVDKLEFKSSAHVNDTLVITGKIESVGTSSMKIAVNAYIEYLSGERKLISCARLVMVALDENNRPAPVPRILTSK